MSDSEGQSTSAPGSDGEATAAELEEVQWTCRKCPGLKISSNAEKDAHREFHRKDKKNVKAKPGPKSRRKTTRLPSPPQSSASLFVPEQQQQPAKRKSTRDKSKKTAEDRSLSPQSRKRRAVSKHIDGSKKTVGKRNGGA